MDNNVLDPTLNSIPIENNMKPMNSNVVITDLPCYYFVHDFSFFNINLKNMFVTVFVMSYSYRCNFNKKKNQMTYSALLWKKQVQLNLSPACLFTVPFLPPMQSLEYLQIRPLRCKNRSNSCTYKVMSNTYLFFHYIDLVRYLKLCAVPLYFRYSYM